MPAPSSLRVLHFIAYPQRMAGANRSLFELVSNYPAFVEPHVVLTAEGAVAAAYRAAGIPITVLPPGPSLAQFGGAANDWGPRDWGKAFARDWVPYELRLARVMLARRTQLVHVNECRGAALAGAAARLLKLPLVAHLRGERAERGIAWDLFETLPDRIIVVADSIKGELTSLARDKAVTVYNGTRDIAADRGPDVPWLQALRASGTIVVGVMASLVPFKACHHLIDALALLNARGWAKRLAVVWVGDQPPQHRAYHDWLEARRRGLGVQNLTFTGWQPDPFRFYRSVDFTVMSSVSNETLRIGDRELEVRGNEGLPRTHLEAMCHALPVVGTRIAGVPEIVIDGETGLLVPPGDPPALADAIERLAADPSLRQRMGAAGRARVLAAFSTASYVNGVLRVYQSVL